MSDEDEIYIDEFLDQVEQGDSSALGSTLDQEEENQNNDNFFSDLETESASEESSIQINYDDIYKAIYQGYKDAFQDIENEKSVESKESFNTKSVNDSQSINQVTVSNLPESYVSDSVEFASNTDAKYYTVSTSGSVSSADEQLVAYMVDTRNIVIIGFSIIILLQFYKIIKGTFLKFVKGRKDSI